MSAFTLVTNNLISREIISSKRLISFLLASLSVVVTTAVTATELPTEEAQYLFFTGTILHKEVRNYGGDIYVQYQISSVDGFIVCETRMDPVENSAWLKCYDTVKEEK